MKNKNDDPELASVPVKEPRRHPLFGCLKGMITIAPGVDLTEPADPELGDWIDEKYGKGKLCDE